MNTIAAISTPAGNGGVGIIRISGNESLDIIDRIFKPIKKGRIRPFSFKLGHIYDKNGEAIDQVLVSYFKAPKSYTGEDVCEINCHGGNVAMKRILETVLENGAVLAEGGEFTKRAFLNGKLDLTQAEAVIELINSKSDKESKASIKQLDGKLGKEIKSIEDEIVNLLADIEANIDYPEYEDIEEVRREKIVNILNAQIKRLEKLEKSFESGKVLKNGVSTAIIGKPNVGKSSLLNALLKEDRAIVTEIPGTTRDTIEEYVTIRGISLRLIDTAGIRKTDDVVENIGVEKSKKVLEEAELVLLIVDGNVGVTEEDKILYELIKEKPHIVLVNKIDLECKEIDLNDENVIRISTKTGEGFDELEDRIELLFNTKNLDVENEIIITNIRHRDLISKAVKGLNSAINSIESGIPIDMISIDIKDAIKTLGEMLGESVSEDVLNKIFEKFCVGK